MKVSMEKLCHIALNRKRQGKNKQKTKVCRQK